MKQFISIALSLLLLLSSSGLTYAQHFCGEFEMMTKVTLGEEHLSCGMAMQESSCGDEHDKDHDCCDNEYTNVDTDDHFAKASFDLNFDTNFVVAFVSVFMLKQFDSYNTDTDFYKDYSPPPLGEDLQVLYESFLI